MSSSFTARDNISTRLVIEGLLAHFFSAYRPNYDPEDAIWFLKLANNSIEEENSVPPAAETPVS